ncbi:MAG: 50S ribosomal protein L23 [Candidatus Midichloria sp.]|uniref:50S ribosomal protein L23 n=1 Tax=Hyalomma marginatum TaxID=34627 RepID=A0A8S4BTZ7_9ACAR|nr:50S ribosomal protein L23 [Hyalomma marginatum]CAG7591418.1 50S ribosomal protein L23 [Hyalomma marginatum]
MRIDQLYDVLISPIFSEKATLGAESRKYIFKVLEQSNKAKISMAVEKIFNVKVEKVNIIKVPAKKRVFKQIKGVKPGFKKAVVTLQTGYSLDLMAS